MVRGCKLWAVTAVENVAGFLTETLQRTTLRTAMALADDEVEDSDMRFGMLIGMKRHRARGFTLIELLVVIAIITDLGAIGSMELNDVWSPSHLPYAPGGKSLNSERRVARARHG